MTFDNNRPSVQEREFFQSLIVRNPDLAREIKGEQAPAVIAGSESPYCEVEFK